MKKISILFLFFLFVANLIFCQCDIKDKINLKASVFWQKNVIVPMHKHKELSIDVYHVRAGNLDNAYSYKLIKTADYKAYLSEDELAYYFDDTIVKAVDNITNELMTGHVGEDFYEIQWLQIWHNSTEFFSPFFDKKAKYLFSGIKDSIIDGTKYKIMQRIKNNTRAYNEKTGKYDIPMFHVVDYYFNETSKCIDYICATPVDCPENVAWKNEFYIKYNYVIDSGLVAKTFDFSSQRYKNHSRHNDDFWPYSKSYSSTKQSELVKNVLDFPVVSLNNDTTNIGQEEGWLLLDFWFIGCPGCMKWMRSLKNEKDTLGFRILENEGIKIMLINPLSNNFDVLTTLADNYFAKDIMYHAKALGNIFNIRPMPKYILVSPEKQIVYTTGDLSDYSELLKAKKEYEQNHPVQNEK